MTNEMKPWTEGPGEVTLTPDEYRLHTQKLQEAVVLEENNRELKRQIAYTVSTLRHLAKTAEDLANNMYTKASEFEDKARSL